MHNALPLKKTAGTGLPFLLFGGLLFLKSVQHIPNAEHIHNAERAVIKTVSGTHVAGSLVPKVSSVVGANVSVKTALVIRL
jgi:hypothetical protein